MSSPAGESAVLDLAGRIVGGVVIVFLEDEDGDPRPACTLIAGEPWPGLDALIGRGLWAEAALGARVLPGAVGDQNALADTIAHRAIEGGGTVEQRILAVLRRHGPRLNATQEQIAHLARTQRETAAHTLKRLRAEGRVEGGYGWTGLLQP